MSSIKVEDLVVDIDGRRLIDGVSFQARPGEVTGLIGPNGAGKSTILSAVAGDTQYSAGTISVAGHSPETSSPQEMARLRAVMLQDVSVSFEFFVRDVVAMGRRPWAGTDKQLLDQEIIDAALAATGTAHLAARDVVTLSGGERARVALARVLAQQTPVILLDEPTAALDIKHQEQVLGLIRSIARATGVAVLAVLHDLNAAAAYCDQIVCLSEGRVAADGAVEEVYTDETLSFVYGWPIRVSRESGEITLCPDRSLRPATEQKLLSALTDSYGR